MRKAKSNVDELLAKIKRSAPEPVKESSLPEREASSAPKKAKIGKAVQFWFHDEDRALIRELSAWVAGQGLRPTDSMVVRAALRIARPGAGLLEAYREASKLDGRIKQPDESQ